MKPGVRTFDHPAEDAEAAAVRRSAAREDRDDALRPQPVAMRLGVVAAIALDHIGPTPWPPATSPNRRQRGDERIELHDVVDVRGGPNVRQLEPCRMVETAGGPSSGGVTAAVSSLLLDGGLSMCRALADTKRQRTTGLNRRSAYCRNAASNSSGVRPNTAS